MKKEDIKQILMSLRSKENEEIVTGILGQIDMLNENQIQEKIKELGESEEKIKEYLNNIISNKQNNTQNTHVSINKMISYGFAGNCVHLHMPIDLHSMISERGISGTINTVNLYLLDAIDKINELKNNNYYKMQNVDKIYMISPILAGRELRFLDKLGFNTKLFRQNELRDEEFVKSNREAQLAQKVFGNNTNVGTAIISFDKINSKEYQDKKKEQIEIFKSKGITLESNENIK